MSHRKRGRYRAALDQAEAEVAKLKPVPPVTRTATPKMWNPTANPVRVHEPKPDPKPEEK